MGRLLATPWQTQGAADMIVGRKASVMLLLKAMTTGWDKGSLKTSCGADRMYVCSKLWPAKSVAITVYSMFDILAAALNGLHCRHLPAQDCAEFALRCEHFVRFLDRCLESALEI